MTEVRASESVAAGTLVAGGMMAMNVMVYGFTLWSAHTLAPAAFGGLGAVQALLIMISVGALALQATGARATATADRGSSTSTAHDILASTRVIATTLSGVFLLLSPLVHAFLNVPWLVATMIPLAVFPLTLLGGFAGVLQGLRNWRWLTAIFVGLGAGRLGCGGAALLIDDSLTAATVGLTLGAYVPAVVGAIACRRVIGNRAGSRRRFLREVWHNGHTLLAFFAFTNLDVLIARNLLSGDESGLYAAGAVLTKSCLFLPQFVIIVAFPDMAEDHAQDELSRAWLKPLGLVAVIGAGVVLGTALLPSLAVTFIGGSDYAALSGYVWFFAIEGTIFALLQMVVYRQIARRASTVALLLWGASAVTLTVAYLASRTESGLDQRTLVLVMIVVGVVVAAPVSRARARISASAGG
ncbi:MAG: polysaccharide biosynthesis protein [Nocardioides sp.]